MVEGFLLNTEFRNNKPTYINQNTPTDTIKFEKIEEKRLYPLSVF